MGSEKEIDLFNLEKRLLSSERRIKALEDQIMPTEVIKREEMLSKCGHKRCSSHVFLLHLNENGHLIIICHLCNTRQKAHELKRGNVPLKNIKQSEENAKKEETASSS